MQALSHEEDSLSMVQLMKDYDALHYTHRAGFDSVFAPNVRWLSAFGQVRRSAQSIYELYERLQKSSYAKAIRTTEPAEIHFITRDVAMGHQWVNFSHIINGSDTLEPMDLHFSYLMHKDSGRWRVEDVVILSPKGR
jgi:uncharacterized protein (TIGR02246 family)